MSKLIEGKTQTERVHYMLHAMSKILKNPARIAIYELNREHHVNNVVTKFLIQERYLSKANIYGKSNEYQWKAGRPTVQMAETVISGAKAMNKAYVDSKKKVKTAKKGIIKSVGAILEICDTPPCSAAALKRDYELKIFDLRARIAQDQVKLELYMSFSDKLDLLQ